MSDPFNDNEDLRNQIENFQITEEIHDDIIRELRRDLKDAYKHISVIEDHMENLLQRVYTMEIENDKETK